MNQLKYFINRDVWGKNYTDEELINMSEEQLKLSPISNEVREKRIKDLSGASEKKFYPFESTIPKTGYRTNPTYNSRQNRAYTEQEVDAERELNLKKQKRGSVIPRWLKW